MMVTLTGRPSASCDHQLVSSRSLIATPPAPAGQPRTRGETGLFLGKSCRGLLSLFAPRPIRRQEPTALVPLGLVVVTDRVVRRPLAKQEGVQGRPTSISEPAAWRLTLPVPRSLGRYEVAELRPVMPVQVCFEGHRG